MIDTDILHGSCWPGKRDVTVVCLATCSLSIVIITEYPMSTYNYHEFFECDEAGAIFQDLELQSCSFFGHFRIIAKIVAVDCQQKIFCGNATSTFGIKFFE